MTAVNQTYGQQIVKALGDELAEFGGLLRCTTCGLERPLGDPSRRMREGWPRHCGYTMRWVTQRRLDEERAAHNEVKGL